MTKRASRLFLSSQKSAIVFSRLTFVRNVGELAEGWYDPITLQRAQASAVESSHAVGPRPSQPNRLEQLGGDSADKNSDDDLVGPALPGKEGATYHKSRKSGPAIPNLQDLELQRGKVFKIPITIFTDQTLFLPPTDDGFLSFD